MVGDVLIAVLIAAFVVGLVLPRNHEVKKKARKIEKRLKGKK